jgi:hypothetical protein
MAVRHSMVGPEGLAYFSRGPLRVLVHENKRQLNQLKDPE